jgi:hypothetical protein
MAIDQKPKTATDGTKPSVEPLKLRDNPEVKAKIEKHKKENPEDVVFYTRLVKENPERAIDTFILRDLQKHEGEMKMIERQLAPCREWYEKQDAAGKARIDKALEGVSPYYRDKAFVNAVFRENDRLTRRAVTNGEAPPTPLLGMKAAA